MYSNKIKAVFLVMGLLLLGGCARFKVQKLSPRQLFNLPISAAGLNYPLQQGVYHEIPSHVGVVNDWLVASEPSSRTIKIFNKNNLELKIVSLNFSAAPSQAKPGRGKEAVTEEKKETQPIRVLLNEYLAVPGYVVAGRKDDFFVQNYLGQQDQLAPATEADQAGIYKILHFNIKGGFIEIIGRQGQPDLPFENILWMDTDSDNRLWVLYRQLNVLYLDQYEGGRLLHSSSETDCDKNLFAEGATDGSITSCEFMYPLDDGKRVMYSGKMEKVPEDNKNNAPVFLHRRIKIRDIASGKTSEVFSHHSEADQYPYLPDEDTLLMWHTGDSDKLQFAIYNLQGDLVDNLQLSLEGQRSSWRSIYAVLSGQIYGVRLAENRFQVYQWK